MEARRTAELLDSLEAERIKSALHRAQQLTNGNFVFPLRRPSALLSLSERCSPARVRSAARTARPCRLRSVLIHTIHDGRLRREHKTKT